MSINSETIANAAKEEFFDCWKKISQDSVHMTLQEFENEQKKMEFAKKTWRMYGNLSNKGRARIAASSTT